MISLRCLQNTKLKAIRNFCRCTIFELSTKQRKKKCRIINEQGSCFLSDHKQNYNLILEKFWAFSSCHMNLWWCFCESDFWSLLFCLKMLKSSTASANGNHMCLLLINGSQNHRTFSTEIKINSSITKRTAIFELFSLFSQRFSRSKKRISSIFIPNVLISAFILQFELLMHENLFLVRCFFVNFAAKCFVLLIPLCKASCEH